MVGLFAGPGVIVPADLAFDRVAVVTSTGAGNPAANDVMHAMNVGFPGDYGDTSLLISEVHHG